MAESNPSSVMEGGGVMVIVEVCPQMPKTRALAEVVMLVAVYVLSAALAASGAPLLRIVKR